MPPNSNYIEKVAVVGAGGNCGKFITESLLQNGKHTVTALTREDSTSKFPDGVHVKKVDYANQASLVKALKGQDALVIFMSVSAPPGQEAKLIDAAAEANVPWILPNEWGSDSAHETLNRENLIGSPRVESQKHISKLGKSSWIAICTGFWYEWSLSFPSGYGFDFDSRTATFYDEGDTLISTSTWPQVGRATAGLLSLPIQAEGKNTPSLDKYRNGHVYVASFTVNQKDMLASILRVTKASQDDWKITKVPVKERYTEGLAIMKTGNRKGFAQALYARGFYPDDSGNTEKTRGLINVVLGLPEEDIDEYTKIGIDRVELMKKWM